MVNVAILGFGTVGSGVAEVLTMNGGLITGCQAPTEWDQASAVMLAHYADFNMSGGMIAGNLSKRNNTQEPGGTKYGSIVDGAVNFLYGSSAYNHMTISGNAIIRNNGGYRNVDGTLVWSDDNADVTFFRDRCDVDGSAVITIKSDFTGSVGIANPNSVATTEAESVVIAGLDGSLASNTVLNGIIDNNSENRVAIVKNGKLYFKDATAQLDVDGKITRYVSFDAAYDIVGDTMPIEMIADASVTFDAIGDSVKVIENGHTLKVNFYGGFDKSDAVAETVGAFKCEEIEFPGVEMDVVTVTAVDGGRTVAMGRLIGDGLYYMMVDIVVNPAFQGKGIGSQIVDLLLAYVDDRTPPGGRSSVQLIAEQGKEAFYIKKGFKLIPHEFCGSGMRKIIHKP